MSKALLALEDGEIWEGKSFGCGETTALGEVCFNTSMTGYQEILTDPSYRGQIVTMTYPLIGNYGINELDSESETPQAAGLIVRELSSVVSNWRSSESLHDYLLRYRIPGIQGIDTRNLTYHLRTTGTLRGILTTEKMSHRAASALAQQFNYLEHDFVGEVTCKKPYQWDAEGTRSRRWTLIQGKHQDSSHPLTPEDYLEDLPPIRYRLVAYDFGIKRNMLRLLRQHGFNVQVVPATTTAEEALAFSPDAIFLSNGPGNPEKLPYAINTIRNLLGKKPIFGICLGHQLLALALGGKTFKLKFGHRGANHPVQDLTTGKIAITSQNHGFAVDPDSLPQDEVQLTHLNLNDHTCAGLRHAYLPVFSVQYHPEAAPGPHDALYFFEQFAQMIEQNHLTA